jgi:Xaa-Pro aminopeptidase
MGSTATAERVSRLERVAGVVAQRDVDALLVTAPLDVRYVTGYTGSNGVALVGAGEGGARLFLTDFRYAAQSAEQLGGEWQREIVSQDLLEGVGRALAQLDAAGGRLGFDADHLTVARHARLRELVPENWELIASRDAVQRLREVKDAGELASIRAAAELVDGVLESIAGRGLVGRTERAVALELEHEMRLRGAQGPSFPSIVASGPHGALPHAEPRDEAIARGNLVTIDLGAIVDGYCSDCTRTFGAGPVEEEAREVYELVLRAQQAAVAAVAPGPTGRELDAVARDIIEAAGHGGDFGHSLGHGVGLDIHEGPRLSRLSGDRPLVAGNVVTVEPGVYLPGRLGVRIEDLVAVTETGAETLSRFTKELIDVG